MVQKNNLKQKLIIICGATATGKTALSVSLAKRLKTEVVSADSMYVYQKLNIGTAKPDNIEMDGIKHHLIDVATPFENFSVSDYKLKAEPIIKNIFNNNKTPIICGGTGFYINSILYDLSYGKGEANIEIRDKYNQIAKLNGNLAVYEVLKEKDPKSAEKLHFNDLKRVIRALEICENGVKKSDIVDDFTPKYDYLAYMIDYPRELLYQRINKRVDLMIKNGLVEEIENLLKDGVLKDNQCMQGIGYKEIIEYLEGKCSLEQATEKIKLNTRHYAKRQITFFKRMQNLIKLNYDSIENLTDRILSDYDKQ